MDAGARPSVATTCPYCGVGCGVLARVEADGAVEVRGDPTHPANFGRLCSKGVALGETMGLESRLLYPQVDGARATWDAALDRVADAFTDAVATHGPDSVAFYVSGQLLTEDYYVANKLMKGFIGSANIDTNSRLCMASSVAGHKRAFGADTVPGLYEDLEAADLIVLVGSNLAWCHPVLFQRIQAAKALRPSMRVVTVDPRQTATSVAADLHLGLAPDTDIALFAGLLRHLSVSGVADDGYVAAHTSGVRDALIEAELWSVDAVAEATHLPAEDVARFFSWFAGTEKVVTVYSQGVNQSATGTDTVNAIINTHLLTGRIGREGMGPFSATGQPNAMGGREVGGLANMLANHMDLGNAAHRDIVQRHWRSPVIADKPGLKAVDLFEAIHEGQIQALWVMATNPSASLPNADRVDAALAKVPFLAVSEVVASNDTVRHAHVALPAAAWGEKDGTVTNSERCISRQRNFLPLPGEVRPDWAIMSDVARRMGFHGFNYDGPHAVFDEYAALSAADNDDTRDFDIGGLTKLDYGAYRRLVPQRWPVPAYGPRHTRFFANGNFYTPDRRGRFVPTPFAPPAKREPRYPFVFNTGRVRDQWHTMTRTGLAPTLSSHLAEPYLELHPDDAADFGIEPAALVTVSSPHGRVILRAMVSERAQRGSVFAPIHWTDETSSAGRIDRLVVAVTDPVSGQPASKSTRVALAPFAAATFGFAVTTGPAAVDAAYWARATLPAGHALEFAYQTAPEDLGALASEMLGRDDLCDVVAGSRGEAAFAAFDDDRLVGAVYFAPHPVAVSRAFVAAQLGEACSHMAVLAGRPAADQPDPGPTICACFKVGANQIKTAALSGARTVDAVGDVLAAGTNCGSCRAEIAALLSALPDDQTTEVTRRDADACANAH